MTNTSVTRNLQYCLRTRCASKVCSDFSAVQQARGCSSVASCNFSAGQALFCHFIVSLRHEGTRSLHTFLSSRRLLRPHNGSPTTAWTLQTPKKLGKKSQPSCHNSCKHLHREQTQGGNSSHAKCLTNMAQHWPLQTNISSRAKVRSSPFPAQSVHRTTPDLFEIGQNIQNYDMETPDLPLKNTTERQHRTPAANPFMLHTLICSMNRLLPTSRKWMLGTAPHAVVDSLTRQRKRQLQMITAWQHGESHNQPPSTVE